MEVIRMNEEDFKALLDALDEDGLEIVYQLMMLAKELSAKGVLPPTSR